MLPPFAYLVLVSNHPLGTAEQDYDRALAELRADTAHVESVMASGPSHWRSRWWNSGYPGSFSIRRTECGLRRPAKVGLFEAWSLVAGHRCDRVGRPGWQARRPTWVHRYAGSRSV